MGSILFDTKRPAAVIYNSEDEDERQIEEDRGAMRRMLHGATMRANWLVAIAIPDVEAWLLADPAVRAEYDLFGPVPQTRRERAERLASIAEQRPVDREAIGRAFPDFRALCDFIKAHAPAPEPVA